MDEMCLGGYQCHADMDYPALLRRFADYAGIPTPEALDDAVTRMREFVDAGQAPQ